MNQRGHDPHARQKLFAILKEKAFRRGRITLASGRESDFYFDMKPAMLDPEGAALMAELILQEIQDVKADCVGGLEMGAVPLIAPVAMRSLDFGRRLPGFFVRKAVEGSRHQEARRRQRHRRQVRGHSRRCDDHGRVGHGRGQGGDRGRREGRSGDLDPRSRARAPPTFMRRQASRSNRCSAPRSFSRDSLRLARPAQQPVADVLELIEVA